jgi:hypothetical protein
VHPRFRPLVYTPPMARQQRGIVIALVVFVVLAVVIRVFGDPLWDTFIRLHGGTPSGH